MMPKKILVIGPSWVGDTVMAQALFKKLKQEQDCQIDVLAPAWTFSLLSCMPELRQAIPSDLTHGQLDLGKRLALAKKLKAERYDQAIVLPNSFKAAIIPWLAGIPVRTGWRGEWRYGLINDMRYLDKAIYPLMVSQYIALGVPRTAPPPSHADVLPHFKVTAAEQAAAIAKYDLSVAGQPILVLAPGGEFGPSKRWPAAYFADVAAKKLDAGWSVWIMGSKKDRESSEEIMRITNNRCIDLAGVSTLAENIHLISATTGVISNDSGLMHVAAALHKPTIAIYGSTSPAFTPPLTETAQVIQLNLSCQPCFQRTCPLLHHRCMRDITPTQILSAIEGWAA